MLIQEEPSHSKSQLQSNNYQNQIIYLIRHSQTQIFCNQSLQLFNLYKRFVQNTIIQLGQDWRIQSGLLAQQIMAEKNLTNEQFCIFNEFMAGFLRKKLGQQGNESITKNSKIINEQQGQQQFIKYFNKSLQKQQDSNQSQPTYGKYLFKKQVFLYQQVKDYSNNLTFNTLSLGFYITAGDIWMKTFKTYNQDLIQQKFNNFNLNNDKKLKYFATYHLTQSKWFIQEENQIHRLLSQIQHKIQHVNHKNRDTISKAIKLGSVITNISQNVIKGHSTGRQSQQNGQITIRTFSLCTQFYLNMFLIWLIFSIKKSFNSSLFSSTCFVRYCDIIIGSKLLKNQKVKRNQFDVIYKQFKLLCDDEWKKLMKDYMMALNDDKQVLKTLIKRIGQKIQERFYKQINGKKDKLK